MEDQDHNDPQAAVRLAIREATAPGPYTDNEEAVFQEILESYPDIDGMDHTAPQRGAASRLVALGMKETVEAAIFFFEKRQISHMLKAINTAMLAGRDLHPRYTAGFPGGSLEATRRALESFDLGEDVDNHDDEGITAGGRAINRAERPNPALLQEDEPWGIDATTNALKAAFLLLPAERIDRGIAAFRREIAFNAIFPGQPRDVTEDLLEPFLLAGAPVPAGDERDERHFLAAWEGLLDTLYGRTDLSHLTTKQAGNVHGDVDWSHADMSRDQVTFLMCEHFCGWQARHALWRPVRYYSGGYVVSVTQSTTGLWVGLKDAHQSNDSTLGFLLPFGIPVPTKKIEGEPDSKKPQSDCEPDSKKPQSDTPPPRATFRGVTRGTLLVFHRLLKRLAWGRQRGRLEGARAPGMKLQFARGNIDLTALFVRAAFFIAPLTASEHDAVQDLLAVGRNNTPWDRLLALGPIDRPAE